MKEDSPQTILVFVVVVFIVLSLIQVIQSPQNALTSAAFINAQGGNVTYVNLSASKNSGFWQGFFGEITVDLSATATPSATAQGGSISNVNLTLPCTNGEIYLSSSKSVTLQNVAAGTKESVDAFLNLSSSHQESGSSVFSAARNFTVGSTEVTNAPAAFTKVEGDPDSTTFTLGVLNKSNVLIFVSSISLNTAGFDGETHDYQLMVPVNQSSLTYYFFVDCEAAAPAPAPVPAPTPGPEKGGGALAPVKEAVPPLVIEIIEKEGKLLATGYPIAILIQKGEKVTQKIQIKNIGEGDLTNIYMVLSGLSLDLFTISPENYERLLPGEIHDFIMEIRSDLDLGTYNIELLIFSDQGSTKIPGVLIVKGRQEEKLPVVGAAAGFAVRYGRIVAYLLVFLLLLFLVYAAYLIFKHREKIYHPCTIEDLLHHHEEGEYVRVLGRLTPLGKDKKKVFSKLTDRTGQIDVLTDDFVKGKVEVKGVVQRDDEQHKYVKALQIWRIFSKRGKRKNQLWLLKSKEKNQDL